MDIPTTALLHHIVSLLDTSANAILESELSITYQRFYVLLVLSSHDGVSQHELAQALGRSDPAVSNMLTDLVREEYVTIDPDPAHGLRRIVKITKKGAYLARAGGRLLEGRFEKLVYETGVDIEQYYADTQKIFTTLKLCEEERKKNA